MKVKKGDFIELDFTASVKGGKVFDTTKEEEAKKAGLFDEKKKQEFESLKICVGEGMAIKGFDDALIGKEINKEYEIEIQPKEAFGIRNAKLIKAVPLSAFQQPPVPGMFVNVNGLIAKVINVAGGRALIDLNSPLAGKVVVYKFKVNRIIDDNSEKIKILGRSFNLDIENIIVEDKKAKIKIKDKKENKIFEKFKGKIKELLNLECEVE